MEAHEHRVMKDLYIDIEIYLEGKKPKPWGANKFDNKDDQVSYLNKVWIDRYEAEKKKYTKMRNSQWKKGQTWHENLPLPPSQLQQWLEACHKITPYA